MSKAKGGVAAAARELAEPEAARLGLTVWDVDYKKHGSDWHLTVFIDKDGGVGLEDCEALSRAIDPLLDEADISDNQYYLVVSSPGLGRALKKQEHFDKYIGKKVSVLLIRPDENGDRSFVGELTRYDRDTMTLDGEKVINKKDTAKITAADDTYFGGDA